MITTKIVVIEKFGDDDFVLTNIDANKETMDMLAEDAIDSVRGSLNDILKEVESM